MYEGSHNYLNDEFLHVNDFNGTDTSKTGDEENEEKGDGREEASCRDRASGS